jgi:mRNA interferase MazF
MRRGDLVTIALQGEFGKPRPALVIQSDLFSGTATVTVLVKSSTLIAAPLFRLTISPTPENGLRELSQIVIDKAMTLPREKVGEAFGRLDDAVMIAVNRALALFLGFA